MVQSGIFTTKSCQVMKYKPLYNPEILQKIIDAEIAEDPDIFMDGPLDCRPRVITPVTSIDIDRYNFEQMKGVIDIEELDTLWTDCVKRECNERTFILETQNFMGADPDINRGLMRRLAEIDQPPMIVNDKILREIRKELIAEFNPQELIDALGNSNKEDVMRMAGLISIKDKNYFDRILDAVSRFRMSRSLPPFPALARIEHRIKDLLRLANPTHSIDNIKWLNDNKVELLEIHRETGNVAGAIRQVLNSLGIDNDKKVESLRGTARHKNFFS